MLNDTDVELAGELKILGVTLYSNLTLESHSRMVGEYASSKLGVLRKTLGVFRDPSFVAKCL